MPTTLGLSDRQARQAAQQGKELARRAQSAGARRTTSVADNVRGRENFDDTNGNGVEQDTNFKTPPYVSFADSHSATHRVRHSFPRSVVSLFPLVVPENSVSDFSHALVVFLSPFLSPVDPINLSPTHSLTQTHQLSDSERGGCDDGIGIHELGASVARAHSRFDSVSLRLRLCHTHTHTH